jgi:hypothetical protein
MNRPPSWFEHAVRRLIEGAARHAPATLSQRLREEWRADLHARSEPRARLNQAVKIELPQQSGPVQIPPPEAGCRFPATWLSAYGSTERATAGSPPRPDAPVRYDFVAKVLAAVQRNGLRKVGFVNTVEFAQSPTDLDCPTGAPVEIPATQSS